MLEHRGFNAWISSGSHNLPIYEPVVDAVGHKVTCWIPSEEGKPFTIHWRDSNESGIHTAAYITLDGFKVPGRFLFGKGETHRAGVRTGLITERPFVFAKFQGGPSRHGVPSDVDQRQLGMIALRIRQVRGVGEAPANAPLPLPATGAASSSRKIDHIVAYGAEVQTDRQTAATMQFEPYDPMNPGSFVTFVFRYRAKEWLEDQGLVPMSVPASTSSMAAPLPPAIGTSSTTGNAPVLGKRPRRTPSTSSRKSRRTDTSASASTSASNSQESQYGHGSTPPTDSSAGASSSSSSFYGVASSSGTSNYGVASTSGSLNYAVASSSTGPSSSRASSSRARAVKEEEEEDDDGDSGMATSEVPAAHGFRSAYPYSSTHQYGGGGYGRGLGPV